jgi:hypothetical protein
MGHFLIWYALCFGTQTTQVSSADNQLFHLSNFSLSRHIFSELWLQMDYQQRSQLSVKQAENVLLANVFQQSLHDTHLEYILDIDKNRYNSHPDKYNIFSIESNSRFLQKQKYNKFRHMISLPIQLNLPFDFSLENRPTIKQILSTINRYVCERQRVPVDDIEQQLWNIACTIRIAIFSEVWQDYLKKPIPNTVTFELLWKSANRLSIMWKELDIELIHMEGVGPDFPWKNMGKIKPVETVKFYIRARENTHILDFQKKLQFILRKYIVTGDEKYLNFNNSYQDRYVKEKLKQIKYNMTQLYLHQTIPKIKNTKLYVTSHSYSSELILYDPNIKIMQASGKMWTDKFNPKASSLIELARIKLVPYCEKCWHLEIDKFILNANLAKKKIDEESWPGKDWEGWPGTKWIKSCPQNLPYRSNTFDKYQKAYQKAYQWIYKHANYSGPTEINGCGHDISTIIGKVNASKQSKQSNELEELEQSEETEGTEGTEETEETEETETFVLKKSRFVHLKKDITITVSQSFMRKLKTQGVEAVVQEIRSKIAKGKFEEKYGDLYQHFCK